MKKLIKIVFVAGCLMFAGSLVKAQQKIGYVNFNAIIDAMPEKATISSQVQDYQKQFIDVLTQMQNEFQTKAADFEAHKGTMTDAVRQQKESELTDMQKRMQDYQTSASQKVDAKSNELAKPLFDKVKAAISQVAKEKGYTYVFDSSQPLMLVSPDTDDLLAAVKLKLGVK